MNIPESECPVSSARSKAYAEGNGRTAMRALTRMPGVDAIAQFEPIRLSTPTGCYAPAPVT